MKAAVRYFSATGKTELVAKAIAKGLQTTAVSTDSENVSVKDKVDILFIGAGVHNNDIDRSMKSFIYRMSLDDVESAVVFSASCFPLRIRSLLRKHLFRKGVVIERTYNVWHFPFCRPSALALKKAENFARKYAEKKMIEKNEVFE